MSHLNIIAPVTIRGIDGPATSAALILAIEEDQDAALEALGIPKDNRTAVAPPTADDDSDSGYSVGSLWIDNVEKEAYRCLGATVGAAIWQLATLSPEDLGTAAFANTGTTEGTVPLLGAGGKLSESVLPPAAPSSAILRTTAQGPPIDNETDPLYIGRWCRVGDSFPFDWYQADTLTTWVMRYSGLSPVIFNEDQSIFQKIVIVGTATNEYLQIQNL